LGGFLPPEDRFVEGYVKNKIFRRFLQMRKTIKGYAAGILTMVLIFTSLTMVSAQSRRVNVNISYDNIRIMLDGAETALTDLEGRIIEPFIMEGVMYVPISPLARLFGRSSVYDGTNRILVIGEIPRERTSLNTAAPFYDGGGGANAIVGTADSVMIGGTAYRDVITYYHWSANATIFSLHNLNRQFRTLSGYIGRVDGMNMMDATFTFIGDGTVLQTYNVRAGDLPIEILVSVANVRQLRIEVVLSGGHHSTYAFQGFLE
jgi:hypothetical protein